MTLPRIISRNRSAPLGCSTLIFAGTAAYLLLGLLTYAVWQISGNSAWVSNFFRLPGAFLAVALSVVQVVYAVRVCRQFAPTDPLYLAWQFIAASGICDLFSVLVIQVLGAWSGEAGLVFRRAGLVAGSLRFFLLAVGLYYGLRIYRQSGFLARFTPIDWLLLALAVAYVVREALDVWHALQRGKQPGWVEVAGWPVDPLLCVLLAEAILLYRSARRMGSGYVGRCWMAFSVAIVLVILGDVSIWAATYGFLPYPWSNIEWYFWLPAAAAFAMAPVYQLEVIQRTEA